MRLLSTIIVLVILSITQLNAKSSLLIQADTTGLPKVFLLGEYEKAYEKLYKKHSAGLLEVCNDDMDQAFDKWLSMLEEMEAYANMIEYDIKGIKVWLNVFWNKDGSIRHIAFHLKVNSRNIPPDELAAFFSSFMNHYKFPLVADKRFSHYGSASFPTFARRIDSTKDKGTSDAPSKNQSKLPKDSVRSKY